MPAATLHPLCTHSALTLHSPFVLTMATTLSPPLPSHHHYPLTTILTMPAPWELPLELPSHHYTHHACAHHACTMPAIAMSRERSSSSPNPLTLALILTLTLPFSLSLSLTLTEQRRSSSFREPAPTPTPTPTPHPDRAETVKLISLLEEAMSRARTDLELRLASEAA